jgi:hypothetical protein
LRWALFEAAQCARRPNSPDHAYYVQAAGQRRPRTPGPAGAGPLHGDDYARHRQLSVEPRNAAAGFSGCCAARRCQSSRLGGECTRQREGLGWGPSNDPHITEREVEDLRSLPGRPAGVMQSTGLTPGVSPLPVPRAALTSVGLAGVGVAAPDPACPSVNLQRLHQPLQRMFVPGTRTTNRY